MSPNYYEDLLYPLQDKVLAMIANTDTSFYLTGGTALSRCYLYHRYSDDLDFFLNHSTHFSKEVEMCFDVLQTVWGNNITLSSRLDSFARFFINEGEVSLKIEFVNDVKFRVGIPQATGLFLRTDTINNIISNKVCALSRNAPKDIADILYIARRYKFNWKQVIMDAQNKDMWVDETEVMKILENFETENLYEVNWIGEFDIEKAKTDFKVILNDILFGQANSLCPNA